MQDQPRCIFLAAAIVAVLAACRTAPAPPALPARPNTGEVGVSIVPPPAGASTLELTKTQAFVFPNLLEPVPMPGYPAELLPRRLGPVEVCVEVDIDAKGAVQAARERNDEACTAAPGATHHAFVRASLDAVRRWTYDPALICIAPPGSDAEDPCWTAGSIETPTPIRLSYVFVFSQDDGKPRVERGNAKEGEGGDPAG